MHATRTRILLAVAGLAALLATACDTAQQVPWVTYNSALQPRIDAATATRDCAALRGYLAAANATSTAHEKATGFRNDATRRLHPDQPARGRLPVGQQLTRRPIPLGNFGAPGLLKHSCDRRFLARRPGPARECNGTGGARAQIAS